MKYQYLGAYTILLSTDNYYLAALQVSINSKNEYQETF